MTIQIRSGNSIPDFNPDIQSAYANRYQTNCINQTGYVKAIVSVIGYVK